MIFGRRTLSAVDRAAMALAAASGVAHLAFFTLFAWRVIGHAGFGSVGYAVLALVSLLGLGMNAAGYYLIKHGGRSGAKRLGYYAISASTATAGGLLAVASFTG